MANEIVELAMSVATRYHGGQQDKAGRPYITHPARVAELVRHSGGTWVQEAAAWLHDVIEDTSCTITDLRIKGIPESVITIVAFMTHEEGLPNPMYWKQIRLYEPSVLVKLCDIYDNLSPERMCYLDQETQNRLRFKYSSAMMALTAKSVFDDPL